MPQQQSKGRHNTQARLSSHICLSVWLDPESVFQLLSRPFSICSVTLGNHLPFLGLSFSGNRCPLGQSTYPVL